METKTFTVLFMVTFLFLFYDSGNVKGQEVNSEYWGNEKEQEIKREYWDNGKLKKETHYKNSTRGVKFNNRKLDRR